MLERVEVETGPAPRSAVIWLHGLGADGHDFEPVVEALDWPASAPLRFVFPHAPLRPVTLNQGYVMRAWYDIAGLDPAAPQDAEGLEQARQQVGELIDHERARGVSPQRLVLAGFSQGGAVALHTALRLPEAIAGVLALSTYLPGIAPGEPLPAAPGLPVMQAHGLEDPVIPASWGRRSGERLRDLGCALRWREYPGLAHGVGAAELADLRDWLLERLGGAA